MKLQYGETRAQESARLRSAFSCCLLLSILRTRIRRYFRATADDAPAPGYLHLDTPRPGNKIVSACRPVRRHDSFQAIFAIGVSGRVLAIAYVASLRARRPRF